MTEEEIKFRDECAMRAMQGLLSKLLPSQVLTNYMQNQYAIISYQFADAMLEEKKKRDEKL